VQFCQPNWEPGQGEDELETEWLREERPQCTLRNGTKYAGQWLRGKPHGEGHQVWPDGRAYWGEFRNGRADGLGKFIFADGSVYVGPWAKNTANGQGRCVLANQTVYEGDWLNGKQHGQGHLTFPDGTTFVGQFVKGNREGVGEVTYAGKRTGCSYQGQFKADLFNGTGTYTWADGRKYEGQWKDSKMNGSGQFTYADGRQCAVGQQASEDAKSSASNVQDTSCSASTVSDGAPARRCPGAGEGLAERAVDGESESDSEFFHL